jgi:hypothetical protein
MRLARLAETLPAINYLQTVGSFGTAAPILDTQGAER